MRFAVLAIAALTFSAHPSQAQHQHDAGGGDYGSVQFRTSCSAMVQPGFQRAVAMLHSFAYEKAGAAFQEISRQDSECAIAWWGVAMTHYHGLWEQIDANGGHAAVEKARAIAATDQKTTARERDYIEAIGNIFGDVATPLSAREMAYEHAMAKLHADYRDDDEATIFYALALDVDASKSDKSYAHQRQARDLLVPLFKKQPNHPGLAHYIIHVSDYPPLAADALGAARRYAQIAPASAHAQHMPSHIFTRLGLWDESIASNRASAASAERDEKTSHSAEAYNQRLHAMDYLEYAYLQERRLDEARDIMEQARSMTEAKRLNNTGEYAAAAIPARFALERQEWKLAARLEASSGSPANDAITWYAKGLGAAHSGDMPLARRSAEQLAAYREQLAKAGDKYWTEQVEIQRLQVLAWMEQHEGNGTDALKNGRAAAELEDATEKSPITPGAIIPARENLAQLLLAQGSEKAALAEYQAVLKVAPGRYNALAGASKSATSVGDAKSAKLYAEQLDALLVRTP
jgi:hypothetical protein